MEELETQENEQPIDPGQQEGAKKDPRVEQDKLTPDSPRFKEVYGKMKDFERQLETLKNDSSKKDEIMDEMRKWNKQLTDSMQSVTETVVNSATSKTQDDEATVLTEKINNMTIEYETALENLDHKKASKIMSDLTDLKLDLREMKKNKTQIVATTKQPEVDLTPFEKFESDCPWYNDDPEMRMYAIQLDATMLNSPKWADKPITERLAEVKKKVEARFEWESGEGEEKAPSAPKQPAVLGAKFSTNKQTKSNSLTDTERSLAAGLGISESDFLKQKSLITGGKK